MGFWCSKRGSVRALKFGADDLDGTVVEEKIYHDAGAATPQAMTRREIIRLIRAQSE